MLVIARVLGRHDHVAEIAAGDATRDVEDAVRRLPRDAARIVFATHAIYQISAEGIQSMIDGIARASDDAPVDLVVMESNGRGTSGIEWLSFDAGRLTDRSIVAESCSHGRWIEWGAGADDVGRLGWGAPINTSR